MVQGPWQTVPVADERGPEGVRAGTPKGELKIPPLMLPDLKQRDRLLTFGPFLGRSQTERHSGQRWHAVGSHGKVSNVVRILLRA